MWFMMRMRVVFPAPLGPSKPYTLPRGTAIDTSSRARCLVKSFVMCSAVRMLSIAVELWVYYLYIIRRGKIRNISEKAKKILQSAEKYVPLQRLSL